MLLSFYSLHLFYADLLLDLFCLVDWLYVIQWLNYNLEWNEEFHHKFLCSHRIFLISYSIEQYECGPLYIVDLLLTLCWHLRSMICNLDFEFATSMIVNMKILPVILDEKMSCTSIVVQRRP